MSKLPHSLYRAEQVRELDRRAIEAYAIPGIELMGRAGRAAFDALRGRWPRARRIGVLCGGGNNGGDGYILARLAREAGLAVSLFWLSDPERLEGTAREALVQALAAGLEPEPYRGQSLEGFDLLVDGLLGTGLSGEVRAEWAEAIAALNAAHAPVLALDIPSGLDADCGCILGVAVEAALTVTFIGLKPGLFTAAGPACCGEVVFDDLAVPPVVYAELTPAAVRIDLAQFAAQLAPRRRDAHKGRFGHVLVIGGERGLSGAARLAAEAAARVGAGLVSVATRAEHAPLFNLDRPELMCHAVEQPAELAPLLRRASVVAVGPGLGRGPWGRALLARVLESRLPLVLDADALNLLAIDPLRHDNWVLTPHPAEAARLLGCSTGEVQADRFAAVAGLQASYGGVCVLKGSGTLVEGPGGVPALCSAGNPGMASGGMGDVLTGVIAGFIAQGHDLETAARLGVCLHAAAADRAAEAGERGLLASDLFAPLRRLANPQERAHG